MDSDKQFGPPGPNSEELSFTPTLIDNGQVKVRPGEPGQPWQRDVPEVVSRLGDLKVLLPKHHQSIDLEGGQEQALLRHIWDIAAVVTPVTEAQDPATQETTTTGLNSITQLEVSSRVIVDLVTPERADFIIEGATEIRPGRETNVITAERLSPNSIELRKRYNARRLSVTAQEPPKNPDEEAKQYHGRIETRMQESNLLIRMPSGHIVVYIEEREIGPHMHLEMEDNPALDTDNDRWTPDSLRIPSFHEVEEPSAAWLSTTAGLLAEALYPGYLTSSS
jgi:hypothetical protein